MSHKFLLKIAYEGTRYCGWQVQPNGPTIQDQLQKACSICLRMPIHVTGSGRTDSGVHALEHPAHFIYPNEISCFKLRHSINALLPSDIRVLSIEATSSDFHARYSAISKTYRYYVHLDEVVDPFKARFVYHYRAKLDFDLLQAALNLFLGKHNFLYFAKQPNHGAASHNPVRILSRAELFFEPQGFYVEFEANGFLYQMVRNLMGAALQCARGKLPLEELQAMLLIQSSKHSLKAVPAKGLFLVKVHYPKPNFLGISMSDEKCVTCCTAGSCN